MQQPGDTWDDFIQTLNGYGNRREPCFFVVDFERNRPRIWGMEDAGLPPFAFPGRRSSPPLAPLHTVPHLRPRHVSERKFRRAFDVVQKGLRRGDSFLTNLTFPVPVELTGTLADVFHAAEAKYRLLLPGEFVCFSPETFVTVSDVGYIESRPMKGTSLDTREDRRHLLLSTKEIAEHATIVDLIRNDLSQVAKRVRVTDYRYFHAIETSRRGLVQTSSNIGGWLPGDWRDRLGSLLQQLLPAGSISGAPKPATLDLIRRAEGQDRGYYCGIAGYFDGAALDTCVLIRCIERRADGSHYFRSGGGITARSEWAEEYAELKAKVRLPLRTGSVASSPDGHH